MEATKKPQNYLRIMGRLFPQNLGGLFPQNMGGLFPQNLGGLTPAKKKLGFDPKCAAAVLPKHTIYKYSGHPVLYFTHSDSPGRAGHRRPASIVSSSSSFFPQTNGLRIGLHANGGLCEPSPQTPRTGVGFAAAVFAGGAPRRVAEADRACNLQG